MRPLCLRFLSRLLWLANAQMSSCIDRTAGYAIKERILRRWGALVGEDIQHIKRMCYGCDGSGEYWTGADCYRCAGSGIYDEKWIRLERWELAGRVFHRPAGYMSRPMNGMVTVEGRIIHERPNLRACEEALFWLALMFDRSLFRRMMMSGRAYGSLWMPLRGLQALVFETRAIVRRIAFRRSCMTCGRHWIRWFERGRIHKCPQCVTRTGTLAYSSAGDDDDLPF